MTDQDAMKLALDALEYWDVHGRLHQPTEEAITALKERLAQPEQEPVAWQDTRKTWVDVPLKNVLKEKRTWVGLKDPDFSGKPDTPDFIAGAFFAEAKLKEKNA